MKGLKCSPALKTLRPFLDRKENEILDLTHRIKRLESESVKHDEIKRQMFFVRKQNDELRDELQLAQNELSQLKQKNERVVHNLEHLSEEVQPKKELTHDLKQLLNKQEFTDCVIACNNERYSAHKCILAIRSEVLRKMIENLAVQQQQIPPANTSRNNNFNQQQQIPLTLELHDINPDLMLFVLNFIYTADTENNITDQNVKEIMKIADKLELTDLRKACLAFMENRINKATVIPILIEAYELNHEKLKKKCMSYLQSERIDLVNSQQWIHFKNENPKLALSLYERYVKETTQAMNNNLAKSGFKNSINWNAHTHSHHKTGTVAHSGSRNTPQSNVKSKINVRNSFK